MTLMMSSMAFGATSLTNIYATTGSSATPLLFSFNDIVQAYLTGNNAFINTWNNATPVALVVGTKTVDYNDYKAAFMNAPAGTTVTPDTYAASPAAVDYTPPATVQPVDNTGNVGEEVANPIVNEPQPVTFTFDTANSLQLGKKKVIVTLNTENPENYTVTCAGVELPYNAIFQKFIGDVLEADAVEANVVVTEKAAIQLPEFTFQTANSLQLGKKKVIVTLDTENPENYTVTCAGVELPYNATFSKFIGDVLEADAVEANVVVAVK
jgi:hypothetical protein